MIFAAYEFVQKRAERKGRQAGLQEGLQEGLQTGRQEGLQTGREEERERIRQEFDALMSNGEGSVTISSEDIKRITRPDRE